MHRTANPPTEGVQKLGYSHREAAELLSISERKLAQLVADGKIRRARAGRKNIFPATELNRFLADELV